MIKTLNCMSLFVNNKSERKNSSLRNKENSFKKLQILKYY